jgi:hypothetical protein
MRISPISRRVNKSENDDPSIIGSIELSAAQLNGTYRFGVVRVATLTLVTLTALLGSRSCGVVIIKFSGQAVTFRSSPTVFAETVMSESTSTRNLSWQAAQSYAERGSAFWACIAYWPPL